VCDVDHFGGRVLIVCEETRKPQLSDGAFRDVGTPVGTAHLVRRARQACRELPLQRMSVALWLGKRIATCSDSDLRGLRLVPRLARLQADAWAGVAMLPRRELESLTKRALGIAPGAVIKRYRLETAEWLRNQGHSLTEIAPSTGYSSKAALCRALRTQQRRGLGGDVQNC